MRVPKRFDKKIKHFTSQNWFMGCSGDRKAAEFDQEKKGLAKGKKNNHSIFLMYLIRHNTESYRTALELF